MFDNFWPKKWEKPKVEMLTLKYENDGKKLPFLVEKIAPVIKYTKESIDRWSITNMIQRYTLNSGNDILAVM